MADNVFDPSKVQGTLADTFANLNASRAQVGAIVTDSAAKLKTLDQQFINTTQQVASQVNGGFDEMLAAQQKLVDLNKNPAILNNIMTIFGNEDYDPTFQTAKVQAAQTKVARADARLNTAKQQYEANSSLIKADVAAKMTEHGLLKETFADIGTAMNTMSQSMAMEAQRRSTVLSGIPTAQLSKMASGAAPAPGGIDAGFIESEMKRRQELDGSIKRTNILNQAGEFELAMQEKNNILQRLATTQEIEKASTAPDANGKFMLHGVEFTPQELQIGLAGGMARDKQLVEGQAKLAQQADEINQSIATIDAYTNSLGRNNSGMAYDPANPLNSLSTADRIAYETTVKKIERATKMGAFETAATEAKALETRLQTTIDSQIKAAPKEEQGALHEFFYNNGHVTPANAQNMVVSFAGDVNAIGDGPLSSVWQQMSEEAQRLQADYSQTGGGFGMGPDGQVIMAPKKMPPEVLAAKLADIQLVDRMPNGTLKPRTQTLADGTIDPITPKHVLRDQYLQQFFVDQFTETSKSNPAFAALVDVQTGGLSADQMVRDPQTGNITWDQNKTITRLMGIYQGNTTALNEVLMKMQANLRPFATRLDLNVANNAREASLNQIIYGNNSFNLMNNSFNYFAAKAGETSTNAQEAVANPGRIRTTAENLATGVAGVVGGTQQGLGVFGAFFPDEMHKVNFK